MSKRQIQTATVVFTYLCAAQTAFAQTHADAVIAYDQGQNQFQFHRYDNPQAALGESPRITDVFGGVNFTSPFNNPWQQSDVVSIGLGGYITLKLEKFVNVSDNQRELGVFTFQQFLQTQSGGTSADATLFYPSMQASLEVSQDGYHWHAIKQGQSLAFDLPANAYNLDGSQANYSQPIDLKPADMSGLSYQQVIDHYQGSAGGNWIDLSESGYDKIGYIRFATKPDQPFSFQLEGISINQQLIGDDVPDRIIGDAQGDNVIDHQDLQIVINHFGQTRMPGDVNFDGATNLKDLVFLRNHFKPSASNIPEPATSTLLALAAIALGTRRR